MKKAMTFEEAKIQVLAEEHLRMPLDHHNLPTAAKDCPLCQSPARRERRKKHCPGCIQKHDVINKGTVGEQYVPSLHYRGTIEHTAPPAREGEWEHPLTQNNEQYHGYTVFTLDFNGVPIKFMTLVDVKVILSRHTQTIVEEIKKHYSKLLKEDVNIIFVKAIIDHLDSLSQEKG